MEVFISILRLEEYDDLDYHGGAQSAVDLDRGRYG